MKKPHYLRPFELLTFPKKHFFEDDHVALSEWLGKKLSIITLTLLGLYELIPSFSSILLYFFSHFSGEKPS